MNSADIEFEVSSLQQQCNVFRHQLDFLVQRFQKELPSIAELWIKREVERRIENNPDKVAALGIEKLKSLKGKLNLLIASLPDIVTNETSDINDWPHNRPTDSNGYGRGQKSEPFFNKAFRNVISHIGVLLDEFDLLKDQKGVYSSWEKTPNGKFRFAINPGFEVLSIPLVKEFEQVLHKYKSVNHELKNKQEELAKAKAKEMWESA